MSRLLSARQTTTDKVLVRLQPSDLNQLVSVKPGAVRTTIKSGVRMKQEVESMRRKPLISMSLSPLLS